MVRFGVGVVLLLALGSGWAGTPDTKAYGRKEINAQLQSITVGRMAFDAAPLEEVLEWLTAEAKKNQYEHRSLNLVKRGLEGVKVRVDPRIENVPLKDALDAVVQGANHAIKYEVMSYGVVFSPGMMPITAEMQQRRFFKLKRPGPNVTAEGLREFFEAHGIDCRPPFQFFLNPRLGQLWVRARPRDLDRIQEILRELLVAAGRVKLELRFAEVPTATLAPDLSLDTGLPLPGFKTPDSELNGIFSYQRNDDGEFISRRLPATNYAVFTGSLDPKDLASVLKTLEQKAGVDVLSFAPRVTYENEMAHFRLNSTSQPGTGPSAAVYPAIAEDAKSIRLGVTAAVHEIMGYDTSRPWPDTTNPLATIYRLRQLSDEFELPLGHTAVLGVGPILDTKTISRPIPALADIPYVGQLFRRDVKTNVWRNLWFFLTPKLEE